MATQSSVVSFNFVSQSVRILTVDDEPWFVAVDVCSILELPNTTRALERLDDDERMQVVDPVTMNNNQGSNINNLINVINQSGLYSLILTSRKPEAKKFKKWVTSEVLPALRRTGRYEIPRSVPAVALITPDQRAQLDHAAQHLAWSFHMKNSTRLWFLKHCRDYVGVNRLDHIPAARFEDVLDFLQSLRRPVNDYLRERVRHERDWLTQTLQHELDRRLGRPGPELGLFQNAH
ncbi:MAG: hypothetical protein H6972_11115 [Gammaproteobacteria bacterium]|nr:hypothetical protein [Gammaproteobacteria bacterium]